MDKAMSVGELIEALKKFPKDKPVWTVHDLHYGPVYFCDSVKSDYAPRGAVIIKSLWLAPDEYEDTEWIDHRGRKKVIKAYQNQS